MGIAEGFISFLISLKNALLAPLLELGEGLVEVAPGVVAALIVLVVGYGIAWIIGEAVHRILQHAKLEKWVLKHTGANAYIGRLKLNHLLGVLAKWYTWMLFWLPASSVVRARTLAVFLQTLAGLIPVLIKAILIAIIGFVIAEFVAEKVKETKAKTAVVLSDVFKVIIFIFTALTVLSSLGINVGLAEHSFLIVLAGAVLGCALALGIGFGLAMKGPAKKWITKMQKKW